MTINKMIKYRENWMGFAMLWIMLFHSGLSFSSETLNYIKGIGYGGVDIFLFASGIGNYYSYTKDEEALPFIKRRLSRLAPVYLPFIVLWCVYEIIAGELKPLYIVGNLLGVQSLSNAGISFNWYLTALIVCYVLTPYLASFVKSHEFKRCFLLILVLVLMSTAFWDDRKFIISASRLPIYTIGMICAKYDSKTIDRKFLTISVLLFCLGNLCLLGNYKYFHQFLWLYGLYWYPFILIAPSLCLLLSFISSLMKSQKILVYGDNAIRLIGKHSFELFLVHAFLFEELPRLWGVFNIGFALNNTVWILAFFAAFLGAQVLNVISNQVIRLTHSFFAVRQKNAAEQDVVI